MTSRLAGLAALAVFSLAAGAAHADKPVPVRVGVVPGVAVNLDAAKVDALGQDLAEALSAELQVDAVGGLDVRRALPADGVPADCFTTPACITDTGHRLNVTQLLFVVMVDTGGSVQIDSTWVDVASGQNVSRPAVDLATLNGARATFASAAHSLLPDAALRPKAGSGPAGPGLIQTGGEPRHFTPPVWITAGVAVAGFGVAIGFGIDTRSHYNSCNGTVACSQSKRDSIRTTGLTADAGLVVGIGAAIASSILYAVSAESPHFVVAPTSGGVAVATGWSF